jgi:hypothetical protein
MNQHSALWEVELALDEVGCMFVSRFQSQLMMISQEPIYWSKISRALDGRT